ncbi:MAG: endonuclease/exonuclease/phosphatase family protein [Phycisphaeraceae bacterium]
MFRRTAFAASALGLSLAFFTGCATVEPAQLGQKVLDGPAYPVAEDRNELGVMSFNLRTPFILDFHNHWNARKAVAVNTIRQFQPDVLGTQECRTSQAEYLQKHLPEYDFIGAGRDDGKQGGEMTAVFYRKNRVTPLDSGHFWLSKTPHKPGSKSWGSWWPRMATWVEFQPKLGGEPFYVFNVHLDSQSAQARREGAKLLRKQILAIAGDNPVVVTGDFNTDAGSRPYRALLEGDGRGPAFVDTFREIHPRRLADEGTHGGFGGGRGGPRIDWILASGDLGVRFAGINYNHDRGNYPSDHRPVIAVLELDIPTLAAEDDAADGATLVDRDEPTRPVTQ